LRRSQEHPKKIATSLTIELRKIKVEMLVAGSPWLGRRGKDLRPMDMIAYTLFWAKFTAPEAEMRRLIRPLNSLSRKSKDSDSDSDAAGFGGGWPSVGWCGPGDHPGVDIRGDGGGWSVDHELGGE
jgi:hypothetical protein